MTDKPETRCRRCNGYACPKGRDIHTACDVTDRVMLLQLCASLMLCDHMGDVSNDVQHVLDWAGVQVDDSGDEDWQRKVMRALDAIGIGTTRGTSVAPEEDEP